MPAQHSVVAVADAARARLFTYQRHDNPGQDLLERVDLVNPERRQRPSEVHSDTRPGTSYAPTGVGFAVDDHRDAHQDEVERRFSVQISAELAKLVQETGYREVVLVASHRMLGHLRSAYLAPPGVGLHELALDLTREPAPALHQRLADLGLLPPRRREA